jgi:hypothetical protein
MTGISFDISIGRIVLKGHFDLPLGRFHEIHLNHIWATAGPLSFDPALIHFSEVSRIHGGRKLGVFY